MPHAADRRFSPFYTLTQAGEEAIGRFPPAFLPTAAGRAALAEPATEHARNWLRRVTADRIHLHDTDPGFRLRLLLDGQPAALVHDDGRGAAFVWHYLTSGGRDLQAELTHVATLLLGAVARGGVPRIEPADDIVAALADGASDGAEAVDLVIEFETSVEEE